MSTLVVGDNDCSFESICTVFEKTNVKQPSLDEWKHLSLQLIPSTDAEFLAQSIEFGEFSFYEATKKMLQEWKSNDNNAATLYRFIQVLNDCNRTDVAEELQEMYGYLPKPIGPDELANYKEKLKLLTPSSKDHIRSYFGGLTLLTKVSPTLTEEIQACGMLTEEEIENLGREPTHHSKSVRLYSILLKKPEYYVDFICCLDKDKQYEPSWILRRIFRRQIQIHK